MARVQWPRLAVPRKRNGSTIFESVWNIEEQVGGDYILRESDLAQFLIWLQEGDYLLEPSSSLSWLPKCSLMQPDCRSFCGDLWVNSRARARSVQRLRGRNARGAGGMREPRARSVQPSAVARAECARRGGEAGAQTRCVAGEM
jgi:hypothetical protein